MPFHVFQLRNLIFAKVKIVKLKIDKKKHIIDVFQINYYRNFYLIIRNFDNFGLKLMNKLFEIY